MNINNLININSIININTFSKLSIDITSNISNDIKKNEGIYFTPNSIIDLNLALLKPYYKNIKTVLEPSCGSCQYILKLDYIFDNIVGIEYNNYIYEQIKDLKFKNKVNILNCDFIKYNTNEKFDLIIGNPPYIVIDKKNVDKKYFDYFTGRPNLFILFIIKCLGLLNDNGILSFILPNSFMNCLYYDKLRNYINNNFEILNIVECNDNCLNTKQNTIIFIIRKNKVILNKFILILYGYTIFNTEDNIIKLKQLYNNTNNLNKLGFNVSIGSIVWNQCKEILTDDIKTRLIYSSDVIDCKLELTKYKNSSKKNYINKKGKTNSIIVINRGYGVGEYKLNYCIIDVDYDYLVENHLICIEHADKSIYTKIINSFNNIKTKEFIKLYFGNNAINIEELLNILPIYDI